jgi:amino acid adenylation domain-containing protein/non-ribosomal peptide synthase protein (TIGR01720 family)
MTQPMSDSSLLATWNTLSPDKRKAFAALMRKKGVNVYAQLPVSRIERTGVKPLSYAQERMWFLAQLEPESAAYSIAGGFELVGTLEPSAVQQAVDALVRRHEPLRTAFVETAGRAEQLILEDARCVVEQHDLCACESPEQQRAQLDRLADEHASRPFDLTKAPLLRVTLIALGRDRHALLFALHHVISDGWSLELLLAEFSALYESFVRGAPCQLPELPIQYLDYAAWQRAWLSAGELDRQLKYWQALLGTEHPVLELPTDKPRSGANVSRGAVYSFEIDADTTARALRFAQAENATLFMLLLAAFEVLLYRWTAHADLRVGVPVSNRPRAELERLLGLFVNTHVHRTVMRGDETARALLARVREGALGAQAHAELPFERLVDALAPERALDVNPLFQVMYNHEASALRQQIASAGSLHITPLPAASRAAQLDLALDTGLDEATGEISAAFNYASELFAPETIQTLAARYVSLLRELLRAPDRTIAELSFLTQDEKRSLLAAGRPEAIIMNRSDRGFVHTRIAEHARLRPDAVALQGEAGDVLTYAQLERSANQWAQRLRSCGVRDESRVGLLFERGPRMLVAALSAWKAGAAFVALDPSQPAARLSSMLADAEVSVLLTEQTQPWAAALGVATWLWLDADDARGESGEAPEVVLTEHHLAYLVYTSGSTGRPKAVAVAHGPLVQHLDAIGHVYGLTAEDCALQFAPMSFDASVEQWANALMHGARVFIRGAELWSAERALELIRSHAISILDVPPAYLRELAEHALARAEHLPVRVCTVGGEALPREHLERILLALGPARLINAYGPTEAVITPMIWHAAVSGSTVYAPIGRAIGPRASYVLDGDLNLVAPGVVGELYLGGTGLARGYFQRPWLSAERFIPDPFASEPGGRMYRTGDLVRRLPSGDIEYLGRVDHQVKLRGFRIELGEVEAALLAQRGVREAVVIAQGGALAARLIGYVAAELDAESVRKQLAAALPGYMVPSQIVVLPALPRSASGKVDRKRLPAPEAPVHAYVAPRNESERVLSEIWREVLSLEADVSVTSNFFELGGDSIVSIQVVSRARQAGLGLTPRHMFEHQTIEALARVASTAAPLRIDQGPALGLVPLSPIQREFFHSGLTSPEHYNQAVLLRCKQALDPARLEQALARLLEHHDALRMRYQREGETWLQRYGEPNAAPSALWVRSARDAAEIEQLCDQAQRSLSLERGELLRALYIEVADGSQRLLLTVHHLVMDGVSFRVLLEDLGRAYAAERLPAKTSSFGAYSEAIHAYAQNEQLAAELEYWQHALTTEDTAQSGEQPAAIEHLELSFDRELTAQLLKQAGLAYRTQIQDLLLTALVRAAQPLLGEHALSVDLEGHGREELFDGIDLSRTIGWFTSKYPVRLDARGELPAAIKRVKESLRSVPGHGVGFGVLSQLGNDQQRSALAALSKPRIAFNYLGQFDATFEDGGLFEVAEESHGAISGSDADGEYWIDINGQVYAGILSFGLTFNSVALAEPQRRVFIQRFDTELRALVAHCCSPSAFGRTPSDYPLAKLNQAQLDTLVVSTPGPQDIYPLTPMQRGMLFHSLYAPELATYVTQLDAAVSGLDGERFLDAWQTAIDRHAILRTGFVWRGLPEPMQVVAAKVQLEATVVDLRAQPDQEATLRELKQQERARPFELERAPLFRIALAQLADGRQCFIWTCHHLLLDGWSTARLLDEVLLAYLGRELPPPTGRFSDYLRYLAGRDARQSEAVWRAKLDVLEEPTRLASSLPPVVGSTDEQTVVTQLSAAETAELAGFAQREHVTINTLIQSAWALILQRYTSQRAVVFGATVSGRPAELPDSEQMLGLFINTLPVILAPAPEWTVRELIQRVQADNLQLREHEHTPLADIQRWAGLGGQGLFDSLLVFENYPVDKALDSSWEGLAFEEVSSRESTNYPLTIAVNLGAELHIGYAFAGSAFARAQIERLGKQLLALLAAFQRSPQLRLGALQLLGTAPAQQLTAATTPAQLPLLDAAILRHATGPLRDRPAVITSHERLTWAELDQLSDRLAQRLMRSGVEPECVVGICMPRTAAFMVSAFAVWKAGGAFLPLDPRAPSERLRFMVQDSAAKLVLTHSSLAIEIEGASALTVDHLLAEPDTAPKLAPAQRTGEHLAYVIYTSGSTGMPKGVGVAHAAISMHCHATAEIYAMSPEDCSLHFASFTFDAAIEQWASPMMGGSAVRLGDDEPWTPDELAAVIERDRVTVIYPPMSHVLQLAEALEARGQRRLGLRAICVGGEAVPKRTIELLRKTLAPQLIVNGYGPTETVVTPLLWAAGPERPCETAYAPIGNVVGDRSCYVLDTELNILPAFATGELYIGGTGSARGYQNRPQLTAERFVPDPYSGVPGARMYRTGDLVRMLADGAIEYLGRTDHQVKLRGFRIELGEIESALLAQPEVSEAYVMVHEQAASKRLVGYVAGAGAASEPLLAALRKQLPEHMVPQLLMVLNQLPRTRHGKVDRARLPRPEQEARSYEAPVGAEEELLAELWREILSVPQVGRDDNFFELGGDSILSILVVSRVRERGYALTPRQLFANPVLSALANDLTSAPLANESALLAQVPEASAGEVPLTPIQRVFFETQPLDRHHFNLSILLQPSQQLVAASLERALTALVAHHPALRFRYEAILQSYGPATEQAGLLWQEAVAPAEIEAACQRAQRSLDIAHGPLLRALLLNISDGSQRLLLTVHHLASDGVSFRILLEDLQTAYQQLEQGAPVSLPASSVLFKTWAERLHSHAQSAAIASELEYWERALSNVEADLPTELTTANSGRESCSIELDADTTRALLKAAPTALRAQVQDVILAALARALQHWTGRAAHLVELEGHGRDVPFEDLDSSRCVGWFTRLYPMLLTVADSAAATVQNIKRYRESMPDAGLGYGLLRELAPGPQRARMRQLPQPRIVFNYLGQFDATFEADGLLQPAAESAGDEVSPRSTSTNWLQLDAQVYQERFECTLQYDTSRFAQATMSALLDAFQRELSALAQQTGKLATPYAVANAAPSDGREADDMALKPRQYSGSPVIQLASGNLAAPLFCLHPAGGVVFDYHILAKRLAGARSVYGIQCRTLIDPTWVDSSIEDMASAYMRLIVETQPEGPYHLLGWSFGADLAIETAYMLEQTGRRVAFLGLVDRLVQDDAETNAAQDEENDVLNMACNLLAARYSSFTQKELLLEAHGRRKRGEDDRAIVRVLVGKVTGASPDAQDAFDLEGLFVMHDVLRNMFRLSEGFALKQLHVAPHCWWSSDSQPTRAAAIRSVEQGLGQKSAAAIDVASNHMQIVYDQGFVESLAEVLSQLSDGRER